VFSVRGCMNEMRKNNKNNNNTYVRFIDEWRAILDSGIFHGVILSLL
jgi:hypothetical protein